MTDCIVSSPETPRRVRVQGDYFHGRIPVGAVYVGRPAPGLAGSLYANPFRASHTDIEARIEAVSMFTWWLDGDLSWDCMPARRARVLGGLAELARRDLACWCALPGPGAPDLCHGDDLLWRANGLPRPASAAYTIREVP